ncbi:MAG: phage holin family protein [Paludibacteraceae bacterium]|nr:phage holin family protein [Paludibacteraceae bacterium]
MNFIIKLLLSALAVYLTALILPGVSIKNYVTAIAVAIVIGLLNVFLKPILILLTIPVTVITLGLFLFVINAGIILLSSYLMNGFNVDGFWWALLFSFVLSIFSEILGGFTSN